MVNALCRAWAGVWLGLALTGAWASGPSWFDGTRPSAQAAEAIGWLNDAADHGLRPEDYEAKPLRDAFDAAARSGIDSEETLARLDRRLTGAVQRYLRHLRRGRVDPRAVHHDFAVPRADALDAAEALRSALARGRLSDALQDALPPLPLYGQLREALGRYRALAHHPAWSRRLPPRTTTLAPGDEYGGLDRLAQRLRALGDLAQGAATPPRYEGEMVDAVRAFQSRHALAEDGLVGPATMRQLEVAPAARARQIELTMERLRWTPLLQGPRMIVINIPEFVLRAYEVQDGRIRVRHEMKVIVGKSLDTRTPLFDEDMRFIEFSPYWNVPPSIARDETVPQLRRDPATFDRQGYEFVAPDGAVLSGLTTARLDAVLAGQLRLRQRPGPRNVLGDIKFVFPNRSHIFLHHTSATRLFERERRDLSHGCIRVESPVELASFVLRPMPDWTEERIRAAMARGQSSTLRLDEPLPVLIAYGTTLVKKGRIHFFDDIYGLDKLLEAALRDRAVRRPVTN